MAIEIREADDVDTPAVEGRLVYPDVGWRLDLVGLRDPDVAEIEEELGQD